MEAVVAPFDHKYVVPELAVKVTDPPAQKFNGPPAVMVGADGNAFTVTIVAALDELRHPAVFVTCTVYDPAVVTSIEAVVSPVDHK